jgi:integrase
MAVMAECPICRKKQSAKNKRCKCGEDLDKAKRSRRVKYWISYAMPDGRQRRESVSAMEDLNGYSKTDAEIALSKRYVQKKEKRVLDIIRDHTVTFDELGLLYLDDPDIKELASYRVVKFYMNKFNEVFGSRMVGNIQSEDLKRHQEFRSTQGLSPASIDHELNRAKAMINWAFLTNKIDGPALKPFKAIKSKLKRGANARKRILGFDEYLSLLDSANPHFKPVLIVAYNTGMRTGELQKLQWKYVDREAGLIRLPAEVTKEGRAKVIPINHHVKTALDSLPRAFNHPYVFTTLRGKPFVHMNGFRSPFKSACERAGVPYGGKTENGVTMHDVRGTVKTHMLVAGVDKVYRDLILGHSLQGMEIHYLSPSEDTLKDAMDRFTDWLDGQLEKQKSDQLVTIGGF